MAVAVVDTGVLVGMADIDDEHHDVAMEIVRGMDHGDLPTGRVTNYIVLETLFQRHKGSSETGSDQTVIEVSGASTPQGFL
jgi:predicted nucleic acid-binding protein